MAKEFLIEIGDFDIPKELEGNLADANQIVNLLFLNPGTYPTAPEMGVGLELYRFDIWDTRLSAKINQKIRNQILQYLPHLAGALVEVTQSEGVMLISIQINNEAIVVRSEKKDDVTSIKLKSHTFK